MTLVDAIGDLYAQVDAPPWAGRNLDALADVLRDLSWLPPGVVVLRLPAGLGPRTSRRLTAVLAVLADETADGPRPLRVVG